MKGKFLTSVMCLAAICLQSCSDDDMKKGVGVAAGTEIKFGAILDTEIKARTHYGEETSEDGKAVWPIYWNYPDNLDQIFIYSPQAVQGRNQASYTVRPENDMQTTAVEITKNGDYGIQAGPEGTTYDFYGLYPASALKEEAKGTSISGTLPAEQSVSFAGTDGVATTLPEAPVAGNYNYVTIPDMNCCLMTALNEGVVLQEDKPVTLNFTPFASVLDIKIPGPVNNNTISNKTECAVTSVLVIADAPIAGDFTYDFSKANFEEAFQIGTNARDSIEISTLGLDGEGNMTGVPLANDNTLRLQAFLLPNPAVKSIQIKVFTSDSQVWTKTLNMTAFIPKQIHKVTLPKLNFKEAKFDYSRWISQLDPRIYLSEISLPGSTSSFSKDATGTSQLQTLDISQQFKAGIRVFRCHIWLYDEDSPLEGLEEPRPSFGINVNGGSSIMPMVTAVRTLYSEMQKNHSDEFCVLMVADYDAGGYSLSQFYSRFKIIAERMAAAGYTPKTLDSNTTIADVKGKVILKLQMNANNGSSDGTVSSAGSLNSLLDVIKSWSNLDGSESLLNWWTAANSSSLFYSPMTYGQTGTFEYSGYGLGGAATITSSTPGLATQAANLLISNTTRPVVWTSNCNAIDVPAAADFDDPSKLWYIYGAQSNPSNSNQVTAGRNMINAAVSAIKTHYKTGGQTTHNKFFMTYLGGAGGGGTADAITNDFVPYWNGLVDAQDFGTNRPFGWVLFNRIPNADLDENLTDAEENVRNGIQKVISRNNDVNFKLRRKLDTTIPSKAAPSGDVKGSVNGGPVF